MAGVAASSRCAILPAADFQTLVEQAKQRLQPIVEKGELFLLIVDSVDPQSVALVLAAGLLRAHCILLHAGRRHKVDHALLQTGCELIVEYDAIFDGLVETRRAVPGAGSPTWLQALETDEPGIVCILTSGSTGEAKVVAYTWAAVWLQARETATRVVGSAVSSWFVITTPVSHAYNMNGLFTAYIAGSTLCLAFAADAVAECVDLMPSPSDTHTNVLFGSPPLFAHLLSMGVSKLSEWRVDQTYCAGSPLPRGVWEAFQRRFSRCIRQNYGTSETGNIALFARGDDGGSHALGFGYKGIAWGDVMLKTPLTGAVLRPGEGEICVRVPWMSRGYVDRGRFVPHHHWYRTGDAGVLDGPHVYVHRRLRAPFRVKHGPLHLIVQSDEVERLYHEHVSEAQGVAATQTEGQGIVAHIAIGSEYSDDPAERARISSTLLRRLRTSLAAEWGYVLPVAVCLYRALPSSPAGKILYSDLDHLSQLPES